MNIVTPQNKKPRFQQQRQMPRSNNQYQQRNFTNIPQYNNSTNVNNQNVSTNNNYPYHYSYNMPNPSYNISNPYQPTNQIRFPVQINNIPPPAPLSIRLANNNTSNNNNGIVSISNSNNQNNQNNNNNLSQSNSQNRSNRNNQMNRNDSINQNQSQNQRSNPQLFYQYNINSLTYCKMDGIFAKSFTTQRSFHLFATIITIILLTLLLLLYKFKVFKNISGQPQGFWPSQEQFKFSLLPFIIAFQSIVIISRLYIFFNTYTSLQFAVKTANITQHASTTQPANLRLNFQENTSQRYLHAKNQVTYQMGLTREMQVLQRAQASRRIQSAVRNRTICSSKSQDFCQFSMLVISICIIVALARGHTTWLQKLVLISTVVYWFLQNYRLIFYVSVLVLCPCITLGVICYVLTLARDERRRTQSVVLPQSHNPTNEQIVNSGGTCSICMMQFSNSDSVISLPCSNKHMFHQLCIRGWLNIKTTCPNCRFDLVSQ